MGDGALRHRAMFHCNTSSGCGHNYNDYKIFKMAAIRHLEFLKFEFSSFGSLQTGAVLIHAKFYCDVLNGCGDMTIFGGLA